MKWSRKISNGVAYYNSESVSFNDDANKVVSIVFIHGVGLRAESWYRQFLAFDDNYPCYAIDMPGHGESALLADSTLRLADFAEVLKKFINTVVKQPAIIVGHSLGAMTALQTAVTYPEVVAGVAALNAIYDRADNAAKNVQTRAESLLNDLEQNVSDQPIARWFDEDLQYRDDAELCRAWLDNGNRLGYARAYQMFAELVGIEAADLKAIKAPALFLTGELDINSKAEMSLAMADILPNAKAAIVPSARHMAQMTHYDAVNSALALFFNQCVAYNAVDA